MNYNQDNLKLYFYWINERQNIWYKRNILKQQPPWTSDKILQDWKFCNVQRQHDAGTIYLQKEIIDKIIVPTELLFNMIIYRIFNRVATYEFCCKNTSWVRFDAIKLQEKLKAYRAAGNPVFTNAFMTSGALHRETKDKIEKYVLTIIDVHKQIPSLLQAVRLHGLEAFSDEIIKIEGIGEFLAYVICSDLVYTNLIDITDDTNTWVHFGAGAKRGLKLIFPEINIHSDNMFKVGLEWLYNNQQNYINFTEEKWQETKKLSLMNIENACCELSKYYKVLNGRRSKVKFIAKKRIYDSYKYTR